MAKIVRENASSELPLEDPEPIDGPVTPVDLARALFVTGPKRDDEWKYLRKKRRRSKRVRG